MKRIHSCLFFLAYRLHQMPEKSTITHQEVLISTKQTYSYLSLLSCVIMYPIIILCRLVSISLVQGTLGLASAISSPVCLHKGTMVNKVMVTTQGGYLEASGGRSTSRYSLIPSPYDRRQIKLGYFTDNEFTTSMTFAGKWIFWWTCQKQTSYRTLGAV